MYDLLEVMKKVPISGQKFMQKINKFLKASLKQK